ncbi:MULTISPECIES: sulfurtransferase, partial [Ramlibacter]
MNSVLNVSAYRFVQIADPHPLRETLFHEARGLGLKGTVLLAHEGINLFLAGPPQAVHAFLGHLREDARFAGLEAKESLSPQVPFRHLRVKVKREIIRMNRPAVQPARGRAPALPAATLRRWLDRGSDDAGRPVVLLDTRNDFEVDHGSFAGAVDWRLRSFGDFPAAVERHVQDLQGKTVVSFCTGGIRCEKAAIVLREAGLDAVWQLEGGILRYLEQEGGAHWRGRCFVFDGRESLDAALQPARGDTPAPALPASTA